MANTFVNLASKHAANFLKTGAFMVISSIASSSLRTFTAESLQEIAKDIRRARNNFRERKTTTT